ncbi:MAG TPA: T9SS type A sorting domain-containing protein [Flavobacteriales bacterium]|nr:T9SS type A sorting domain-containing protein [Flavobacteriales bacterium]
MIRTTTTLACLLGLGAMTHAQTITQANAVPPFGPLSGERYYAEDVPWNLLDTVGSDLLWDLSGLNFTPDGPVEFFLGDVATSSFAFTVPNASIVLEEIIGEFTYLRFYNNLPGSLELIATGVSDPDNTDIWEACPTLQMTYPGVLGTTVSPSLADCDLALVDYERRILANGSIATSFGNISDVVLIRTRRCETYEVDGQWFTDCYNAYEWFQSGNILVPVISAELDAGNAYVVLDVFEGTTGVDEQATTDLILAPNPARERITIQHRAGQTVERVTVHGADGRLVNVAGTTVGDRFQLDVQALTPGVYTLQCLSQGRMETLRFVKE